MAAVIFLRGVNVGGRRPFRPAAFARQLSSLDLINIGAAGTFIVPGTLKQATLRAELLSRLPFETELRVCRGRDLTDLVAADPFPPGPSKGVRRFVSVLARRPSNPPRLPSVHPPGGKWQVKIVGIRGRFVLSLLRPGGNAGLYPNQVVEKELAVPATTRGWDTICKICHRLG